ncbi:uncharacterized protein EI97DRAFT_470491 [Westerdykella ornata]|uniref:DUF676 domain-containing protein n=1 Tax=Westerdykella ornata TaxID=318751 RepID=A0A6A6J879_WESOR|nr:uncharacterized protein EI97DRAFT_470491 [Westerdykella ornata]KAF2272404.1 hypothetical protein EI97DRAFT_470491 [Westerdykella ornata]
MDHEAMRAFFLKRKGAGDHSPDSQTTDLGDIEPQRNLESFPHSNTNLVPRGTALMAPEETRPYGPLFLYEPPNAEVDIILIHGLGGDRQNTWTWTNIDGERCFWPADLLPTDLPRARVITWGYAARTINLVDVVSQAPLKSHADKLCTELSNLREGIEQRPLFFVAHSLGGIVTKRAILHSSESNLEGIAAIGEGTRGVVFMGTPHDGSGYADVGSFLINLVKIFIRHQLNNQVIEGLKSHNREIQELERRFNQLLLRRRPTKTAIEARCFCETEPMNAVVGLVVPSLSSAPPAYETPIDVDANHVNITKFSGPHDQTYQNVLAELKRMIRSAKERQQSGNETGNDGTPVTHVGNNTHGALANYAPQNIQNNTGGSVHYGNVNTYN